MAAIVTDAEEVRQFISDAVHDSLRQILPEVIQAATRKPFLTKDEVKGWTGWSERTLQHLRDTRQIPFVQHGRKICYPATGIESFLRDHGVRAHPQT